MTRRGFVKIAIAASFFITSCSTTRVLQEGEYRLARNKIEVEGNSNVPVHKLEPYIKQAAVGWTPFLSVYNWQNGKNKGWDKFVRKIGVAPVVFNPDLVESSEANLTKRLEYLGYYGSTVSGEVKTRQKKAYVTYRIEPGEQIVIKDIDYVLPEGELAEDFLADTLSTLVHRGDFLSEELLEKEAVRAAAALRERGYYDFSKSYFSFEADTLQSSGAAHLVSTITDVISDTLKVSKYRFNEVNIHIPKSLKVRENVLRHLNTIAPGSLYNETDIKTTYSRLSSLRIFSSVNIGVSKVDSALVNCDINLSQTRLQGFKINVEASVNSTGLVGVSPRLSYYHKNIFHGGEWLNLGFLGNFQFKFKSPIRSTELGVSASLSFPKFFGLPYRFFPGPSIPRTDIGVSYNYQERPEYTRNIITVSYGYSGNALDGHFYYQAYPAQLNIVMLPHIDQNFYNSLSSDYFLRNAYQNHFDLGLGCTLYYTTDPAVNPKTSVFYTRLQADLSGNLLSAFKSFMKKDSDGAGIIWNTPYSQYVRAELTVGKTWRFGKNNGQAVATRLQAGVGYAYGNSSALPFEKHFYVGGANSLRGWQTRSVGPGTVKKDPTFVIPNQTGDIKLEANAEYRFKIFWKIAGAAFLDAGNVWTFKESGTDDRSTRLTAANFGKSIAFNWGAGIRLDLDFLVLRVDLGLKIHDPIRDQRWVSPALWFKRNGYAVHFGVGYPF